MTITVIRMIRTYKLSIVSKTSVAGLGFETGYKQDRQFVLYSMRTQNSPLFKTTKDENLISITVQSDKAESSK